MRTNIVGALCVIATVSSANAAVREDPVTYTDGETTMKGFVVYDDANEAKRPGIVMVHEWWGITKHIHDEARKFAQQGYTAFIADMYGDAKTADNPKDAGALSASYQVLGKDFVQWQLERIGAQPGLTLPSLDAAWEGFQTLGHRPEELLKALRQLQQARGTDADTAWRIICATLAGAAADADLKAFDDLGELVMRRDGTVHVVPPGRMPTDTGVAAVYRF